jgi:hypothetical protein
MGDNAMGNRSVDVNAPSPEPGAEHLPAQVGGGFFGSPTYQKLAAIEVLGHRSSLHASQFSQWMSGGPGVAMGLMGHHPMSGSTILMDRENMLRCVPTTLRRRKPAVLHVGDAAPEFALEGSHGHRVNSSELRGKPIAIRLTRTMGSGML